MLRKLMRLTLVTSILMIGPLALAQDSGGDAILFIWNDELVAQSIAHNELIAGQRRFREGQPLPPTYHGNVFSFQDSPLLEPPIDGYGFYQGVWSSDHGLFAFLALQPNDAGYHIIVVEDGEQSLLFSGQVNQERGYLVPVGWAQDDGLILLERHMLHNLREVRLWRYDGAASDPTLYSVLAIPDLKGNSASLQGGWVFIGFDTIGVVGYLVNINTGQLIRFPTSFALQEPPSVFEVYPIDVVGVVNSAEFKAWSAQNPPLEARSASIDPDSLSIPFLFWPLPDHARSITCYPDSEWTDLHFAVECPGLTVPRPYQGHEGTDVGGKPDGLAVGTHVHAAAPGLVVKRYSDCEAEDITCGDAYGNYLLLEHSRVIDQDIETWFTGYAHLQVVLVDLHTYIREIGIPIALSGDTGLGGAHLHFEIRSPQHALHTNWIDPWDPRHSRGETGLWIGENTRPEAAVVAAPPASQLSCQTLDGNNIRSGPGTNYEVVAKSLSQTEYEVFQVQSVKTGDTPGDWYHIRWPGTASTGWIWSTLMTNCVPVAVR